MNTIEVSRLVKKFGTLAAVDDVSFDVGNEIVSLLGPSGCGKTTTLRCIAGFEAPDQGKISIMGQEMSDAQKKVFVPAEKRGLGMVFQSYALWPHMTVYDNIAYPLKIRKIPKPEIQDKVKKVLALMALEGLESRYPSQLSGGQQQRIALGRSIVYEPKVLLLDEPLSNLDFKMREKTRGELRTLLKKIGIASVYVTHDQEEAFVLSDRVIVMNKGKIVQEGSPAEIYSKPADEFVGSFIGRANLLTAEVVDKNSSDKIGHVKVKEFDDLDLECGIPEGLKVGDHCWLLIRANEVGLFDHRPRDERNVVEGAIIRREFRGPVTDHMIEVYGAVLIVTTHRFCPYSDTCEDGDRVFVAIPIEAITLVPLDNQ